MAETPKDKAERSLREAIFAAAQVREELVKVPEWGDVEVLVRGMSGRQRDAIVNGPDGHVADCRAVIECALDPKTHEPIFRKGDLDALMEMPAGGVLRISAKILELSGLTEDAEREAGEG